MSAADPTPSHRSALLIRVRMLRPHAPHYQELLDRLDAAAAQALAGAGWAPRLVAAAEIAGEELLRSAREADVIVVLGGEDVDPALYDGATDYPGAGRHETGADRATIAVIRDAVDRRAPLVGVCRGHQLLNVALGGTLVQDLPGHRATATDPFVVTRCGDAADGGVGDVARSGPMLCTHHQAIGCLAPGLTDVVHAADGVVEAVAHDSAPIIGVQWHPEHPDTAATQLTALVAHVAGIPAVVG